HGTAHATQYEHRVGHVHQNEAAEGQVHWLRQEQVLARLGDGHHLGVRGRGPRHLVTSRRVAVDGVDAAVPADDFCQGDADVAAAGAHVDALPSLAQSQPVESRGERTPVDVVAQAQLDHGVDV